jgi:hypothetical protein
MLRVPFSVMNAHNGILEDLFKSQKAHPEAVEAYSVDVEASTAVREAHSGASRLVLKLWRLSLGCRGHPLSISVSS